MGIFDSYFDPSAYQVNGGTLIDRLLSQLGTQSQYQPAQGFPQNPMNAQAAMPAQPQNEPIAIGNYQMPRIGGGFPSGDGNTLPRQTTQEQAAGQLPAPIQQQQPPAFLQPQRAPGGFGSAMQGAIVNAHNGPLGMLIGGVAGGMGMGQGSELAQRQRALQQKYYALVPILGEQKAQLAVLGGADAEKQLLADALGKTYGFTTLPDGTVVRQDPKTGTVEPVYQGGAKPTFGVIGEQEGGGKQYGWIDSGKRTVTPLQGGTDRGDTVTGPDGKPIQIPPGVDRKTFVNEISKTNADAASGKMTEVQAKASSYAARMELAEKTLKSLATEGSGFWNRLTETTPVIGGTAATTWMQGENYQKYRQARDNFISGVLRQESGAAIAPSEFARTEKEYFPQPGDTKDVMAQKAKARAVVIEQMKRAAGPGYKTSADAAADAGPKADPLGIR